MSDGLQNSGGNPPRQMRVLARSRHAAFLALLLASTALIAVPAWADGGKGGDSFGGSSGGAGGAGPNGAAGSSGGGGNSQGGSGGGGGGAGSGANNGGVGGSGGSSNSGAGGAGGAGGTSGSPNGQAGGSTSGQSNSGGGGGGGGYSAFSGAAISNPGATTLTGGTGGNGGGTYSQGNGAAGGGGEGGYGAVVTGAGASSNAGSIAGGTGGAGGNGWRGGNGGAGGIGVDFTASGVSFTNTGSVSGGAGGALGNGLGPSINGTAGAGGAGIVGSGLTVINNGGTITGGLGGDGVTRADAIAFTGGANTLTLNGGTITGNVSVNGTGSLTFNQGTAQTLSNVITGNGSVVQNGAGTLTLSGANTYTGGTTITTGILAVSSNSALGTGTLTLNGGTLLAGADNLTLSNGVALNTTGGTIDTGGAQSINLGAVQNGNGATGTLTIANSGAGTGIVRVTGSSTYAGPTVVGDGTHSVVLEGTGAFASANSALTVNANSYFNTGGSNQTIGSLAGAGTVQAAGATSQTLTSGGNNSSTTFSGVINDGGGTLALAKAGSGTLTLSGTNTYTGGTTISGGKIIVGNNSALGTGAVTMAAGTALGNTGTHTLANNFTLNGDPTYDVTGSDVLTISGILSDGGTPGVVEKTGTGTLTLSGTNTYSGGTSINAGIVNVTNSSALGTGPLTLNGGTLQAGADNLVLSNSITPGTGGTIDIAGNTALKLGGISTGSGAISFINSGSGNGTISLSNVAGNFTGATIVGDGTHAVQLALASGGVSYSATSPVTVNANATLLISRNQLIPSLTGAGTVSAVVSGGLAATLSVGGDGSSSAFAGVLSDGNSTLTFYKTGTGTFTLSGANTYSGATNVTTGTLALSGTGSIAASSEVQANGTFDISGTTAGVSVVKLTGSGAVALGAQTLTVTAAGGGVFSGVIRDAGLTAGTGGGITISGQEFFTGNNTYTGTTTINAGGSLYLGGGGTSGSLGGGAVLDNGALIFNRTDPVTLGVSITGSGQVSSGSTGTVTITAAQAYTGTTTLSSGTFALSGAGALATSSQVALSAGSTLDISQTTAGTSIKDLNGAGSVALGAKTLTITSADGSNNFSGAIGGGGGLTLSGGTLTLKGANGYTGSTAIANGATLSILGGTIAASSGVAVDGMLLVNPGVGGPGNMNIKSLSGAGTVELVNTDAQTLTLTAASGTFSGNIVESQPNIGQPSGLIITGGTETLSGSNSYRGGTTISGGKIIVGNDSALGTGAVTMAAGTALGDTGTHTLANNFTLNGDPTFQVDGSDVLTISGILSDGGTPGVVEKSGTGTLALTGVNTYSGGTTISGGTLQVAASGNLGTGAVTDNANLLFAGNAFNITVTNAISGSGTLTQSTAGTTVLTGANSYGATSITSGKLQIGDGNATGTLGTGAVTDNGELVFSRSDTLTVSNAIGGTGILTQAGVGGTLILTGVNTYASITNINTFSTLSLSGTGSIASSFTVRAAGTFDISAVTTPGGASIQDLRGAGTVKLGANTLTVTNADVNNSFDGSIQGTGGLTVSGGTLNLHGANSYTGATIIGSGATLALSEPGTIAASSGVANAGIFDITGMTTGATITALSGSGTVNLGAKLLTITSGTGVISGSIAATTGSVTLSGGTTTIAASQSVPFQINAGAGLQIGAGGIAGDVTGAVTNNGTVIYKRSDTVTYAAVITGNGNLVQAGTGTLVVDSALGAANVTISGGTLQVGNADTSGSLGTATVTDNAALVFNRTDSVTVANAISGTGTLTQAGTGTTILTGANSYGGGTTISAGTLQIGNGGANGSLGSGNVTDNGTLAFNRSDTVQYAGTISGSGVLAIKSGTVVLAGANTYTGGTSIAAGATLQLGIATANGSIAGNVANAGTLALNNGSALTYAGIISGSGQLTKAASGTTILTGNNTYTGATTITAGTLQIGNGGASGSYGTGGITDNGMLAFNRSDTITNADTIAGTGGVEQKGSGTVILTGANSYAGVTLIDAGATLQIGNGGTTGSYGAGAVTDNGTLVFNRSDTVTIASAISGTGGLTMAGSGTLVYDAAGSSTGATNILSGIVEVGDGNTPGAFLNGPVNVESGGTLMGHGTVKGNTAVASGGTLRPGGTIGTLTVTGNASLAAGSTFVEEIDPSGAGNRLEVGGTATIAGALQVVQHAGTYVAGTDYRIVNAASVSGAFSSVSGATFPGLVSTLQYSATAVDLILSTPPVVTPPVTPPVVTPPVTVTYIFPSYGKTPNQIAAGTALTAAAPTGALYTTTGGLVTSNAAAAPAVLEQLSGDIHASIVSAAIQDSRMIRNAVLGALDDQREPRRYLWIEGYGGYSNIGSDANASALHDTSAGVIGGVDLPVTDQLRAGIAAAYSVNTVSTENRQSQASGEMVHVIGDVSYVADQVSLAAGIDYGTGAMDNVRLLAAFGDRDVSHRGQDMLHLFARAGYRIDWGILPVIPYAGIVHVQTTDSAFAETGGITAVSVAGASDQLNYSMLGLRTALQAMDMDGLAFTPRIDIAWDHSFGRFVPNQRLTYQKGGTSFTVLGVPLAQDSAAVQVGGDLAIRDDLTISLHYDGMFATGSESHAVRGGLRWRF